MAFDSMHSGGSTGTDPVPREIFHVRAVVEADPSAIIRILQHFQARNIVPHRVSAQSIGAEYIQIDVDVAGLSHQVVGRIVAKIRTIPSVIAAALWD